ncbi:MAG: four helix bundle protein [Omnitrophica bacterium RIFOXYB12_FULL_50_7]|nr:MAG: four helix bundle protein [Omnitrophica bacterium RIFOXYB12_FULL_50_7]
MSLAERIYHLTEQFPSSEKFGLISQLRRAAVSVPSNVAEGYRRRSLKEFQQFLNISIGSIGEIETQIILAGRLRFFQASEQSALLEDLDHLLRMTINLKTKMCR